MALAIAGAKVSVPLVALAVTVAVLPESVPAVIVSVQPTNEPAGWVRWEV